MRADLRIVDVERVRFSGELDAYASLEREDRWTQARYVPQDGSERRRGLLANALLLTDTMAPEAYAAARDAMASLGVEDNIELFQSGGHGVDTARLVLFGNPVAVEFIGGYLGSLDRGGILAVVGHEIGHCLAHSANAKFAWAFTASQSGRTPDHRAYAMAAEVTADRFGLLACRDPHVVLRLEMQGAASRSASSLRFDTESYLTQCRAVAEEIIASGGMVVGKTHPEHYVRGYAEWLFSETDVYASITGVGPASRSIDEVDDIVRKLLGIRRTIAPAAVVTYASSRGQPTPGPDVLMASVGEQEDVAEAKRGTSEHTLEDLAADILTEGARRKLAATGRALATVARGVAPSMKRFADAAREYLGESRAAAEPPKEEGVVDPLDEDQRELLARFEELERRSKEK